MTSQVDRYLQHNPEKTDNGIHLNCLHFSSAGELSKFSAWSPG